MNNVFWLKTVNITQGVTPPLVWTKNMKAELARQIAKTAFELEAETKTSPNMPVDTGNLRDTMKAGKTNSPYTWEVSDATNYGVYQELGTRYVPARHFLSGAAMKIADKFFDAVAGIVGGKKVGEKKTELIFEEGSTE